MADISNLLPGDVVKTTFGSYKLIAFEERWPSGGLMQETWRIEPTDDSWKATRPTASTSSTPDV